MDDNRFCGNQGIPHRKAPEYCLDLLRIHDLAFQNIIRRRKCTFHLIVYNTIVGQRAFFFLKMVVPAFLAENLFFVVDIGIKYRIQIYVNQILEVLVITAGYRIASPIRIGHGI